MTESSMSGLPITAEIAGQKPCLGEAGSPEQAAAAAVRKPTTPDQAQVEAVQEAVAIVNGVEQPDNSGKPAAPDGQPTALQQTAKVEDTSTANVIKDIKKTQEAAYQRLSAILGKPITPDMTAEEIMALALSKKPADLSLEQPLEEVQGLIPAALEKVRTMPKAEQPPPRSETEIKTEIETNYEEALKLLSQAIEAKILDENDSNLTDMIKAVRQLRQLFDAQLKAQGLIDAQINQWTVAENAERSLPELTGASEDILIKSLIERENAALKKAGKLEMTPEEQAAFSAQRRQENEDKFQELRNLCFSGDEAGGTYIIRDGNGAWVDEFKMKENIPRFIQALKELAAKKGPDDKPPAEAIQAQQHLAFLEDYLSQDGTSLEVKTRETIHKERAERRLVTVYFKAIEGLGHEDLQKAIDGNGQIDEKALRERLAKTGDVRLANMLNLLIFYRKTQTGASSPEVKQQVLSLMRIQLQELNENGALAAPVAGELQKISEDYKDYYDEGEKHFFKTVRDLAIEENIPLPENWKQGVDLSKLYRALTVSLLFEDAKCVAFDPARRDFGLTGTAKEAVQTLIGHDLLDAEQYSFIVHAIHNKTASSLLGKTIGFEKKDLHVSPVEIATYAAEQIGKRGLVKKEHIPLLRDIFRINLEESEEIFRNKFQIKDFLKGLRGAGTTIGLLAMMFSPYIGALMGTGEEKEQAQ